MTQVLKTPTRTASISGLPSRSAKGNETLPPEPTREREAGLSEKETSALAVAVAEMKGSVINELKNQRDDIKSINSKLDALHTRREAEVIQAENARRFESLEADRRWAVRQIISIWLAGLATAVATAVTFARKVF